MEQWTGSRSGKEYIKAVYCHPAYLTSMQSTPCEMPGWMKHKLESRLLGEKSVFVQDGKTHNKLRKILEEMGIPDHLTCLLRNLHAGQEATVRTGHGITDWFQTGKGVHQRFILSPCLFNLYAEYIMRNIGWMKHKLESWFSGEMSITSDIQMTPHLWQKGRRNKEPLDES